jgi:outer membrane protein TolC
VHHKCHRGRTAARNINASAVLGGIDRTKQRRFNSLNQSVLANRRALEIASELYSKGLGDFLNVLDSERALFGTEDQLVDSQRAVSENLVALYKALGGGWETTLLAKSDMQNQPATKPN